MSGSSPLVQQKNYSVHWDAVRGLSILIMILVHTNPSMQLRLDWNIPILAVSSPCIGLIFMISGFLITRSCCRQIFGESGVIGKVMWTFALRRMLRTWPLYFLFVTICFLIPTSIFEPINQSIWSFYTFTMNMPTVVMSKGDVRMLHLWSTCLEEWSYLIFLFLIPLIRKKYISYIFLILALTPIVLRFALAVKHGGTMTDTEYLVAVHNSTVFHCDDFWWGCLLGRWSYFNDYTSRGVQMLLLFVALLVSALYLVTFYGYHEQTQIIRNLFNPTIGALVSGCLIIGVKAIPGHWIKWTGLHALGLRTYTIYLVHFILMELFAYISRKYELLPRASVYEVIGAYAFMLLIAFGLFEIFERPILKILKTRLRFTNKVVAT